LEEAEAIEKALTQQASSDESSGTKEQPQVDDTPESVAQAEPTPEAQKTEDVPPLKAKPGKEEDADYWRSRATSMYGINQTQAQQLHELRNQVSALTTEIAAMRAKPESPKPAEPLVTDKDVETFGSDLIDLQERIAKKTLAEARAEFKGVITQQADYIKQLEARLGAVDQKVSSTAQDRFYEALTRQVPEWEQINADQRFLQWLGQTDQMTGITRQAYLDDAANRLDLARVAAIFTTFKQMAAPAAPVNPGRKSELERQVSPGKSKPAAPESGKRTWTKAEFERAMDPRFTRHMSSDEVTKLEAELDLAVAEGRVQF